MKFAVHISAGVGDTILPLYERRLTDARNNFGDQVINCGPGTVPHADLVAELMRWLPLHEYAKYTAGDFLVKGLPGLREQIAEYVSEGTRGHSIHMENVLVTLGATGALFNALSALCLPGEEVILFNPGFIEHYEIIGNLHLKAIKCLLNEDDTFSIDFKNLEKVWSPLTRVVVIANPSNPTGVLYSPQQLVALEKFVAQKGAVLIVDNSFIGFAPEYKNPKFNFDTTIIIGSGSKTLQIHSHRIGWAIGSVSAIEMMARVQEMSVIQANVMSQLIVEHLLRSKAQAWIHDILPEHERKRTLLKQELLLSGLFVQTVGDCGPYVFAKLRDSLDDDDISECFSKQGVINFSGSFFGIKKWIRFSFGMISEAQVIRLGEIAALINEKR